MAKRFMPVSSGSILTSGFGPRGGAQHRGTDYGRNGGSGNDPIYAAQGGTVIYTGAASGFGGPDPAGWIVIDHPTADGSGTTVYGHVIRDNNIQAGVRVEAGQKIGRINPDSRTNGHVAPHLHFEVHPSVWRPGTQVDPARWLKGAPFPNVAGNQNATPTHAGAIFGVDISEHQANYSLKKVRAEGADFVILRLCDGTRVDRLFKSHLKDAESTDLLVSTYWYLRAPVEGTTISQQVDVIDRQMGGRRNLGVWIDVESINRAGAALLTEKDVWDAKRELEKRGYHVPGIYSGAWYWEKMPGGEPSMKGLGQLWVSHYGQTNQRGNYRDIYPGNSSTRWDYPLGDRKPDILQYGSNGVIAGQAVDVNAFKGTRQQLAEIFHPSNRPSEPVAETDIVEEIMTKKIQSRINKSKQFDGGDMISFVDEAAWQNRVLLKAVCAKLEIDPDKLIAEAIAEDNAN